LEQEFGAATPLRARRFVRMTEALQQLLEQGHTLDVEALSALSPYRTEHINRSLSPVSI
jgi:hypothetical protein